MLIFVSAERRIFQLLGICRGVDVDRAGLRYVPRMPRIRGLVRMLRGHPFASDGLLAVALAAFVLSEVFTSRGYLIGSNWVYLPVAVLMTVPLAWRRSSPLVVVTLVMGAFAAQSLILDPTPTPDVELIPALMAVYSVAAHSERWVSFVGGGLSLVAGLIWLGIDDFLLPSVMFVQAGAERLALGEERPATREALLAIERTGREALAEMSRLLGILRKEGEGLSLAPRPSLAQVDVLVQTVRDAGLPVELRVEGAQTDLPPGVDVSAYRIVQEAFTNVVKHAGPARASVVVRYGRRAVEVEVTDDGRRSVNAKAAGYGLAGMRERVELHGGTLEAGSRSEGGFAVKAQLPLGTVPA